MDHLPAVSRRFEAIPYLGMEGYKYSHEGFYLFPDKHGQSMRALLRGDAPRIFSQRARESFFQAWLYFGLLDEFAKIKPGICVEKFYDNDEESGAILHTKTLLEYLQDWLRLTECWPESIVRPRQMRATIVLKDARMIICEHIANASPGSGWWVDPLLATSFMILGETLSWAMQQLEISVGGAPITGWTGHFDNGGWGPSSFVFGRLREQGWCPYSISMLRGMLKDNVSGLYYATTYPTSPDQRLGLDHSHCTDKFCSAKTPSENTYRMRHVKTGCTCSFIEPDVEDVVRVLESDSIPVLCYMGSFESGTARLQVQPFKQGMKYIVVSHVWADGLGNPYGNGMVTCQIQRLTQLAGDLLQLSHGNVFFWIDTLLVPVDPQHKAARKRAIRKMHEVYTRAYKTIVLDGDLMEHRVGQDYVETAMRITISGWMQRLWTLQEGVMSRSIYFLFQNGLQDIEDLDINYPAAAARSSVAGAARAFYSNLLRPHNLVDHVDTKRIGAMWKAMQWRQTSKRSDETMAIARILNVDPTELVDRNDEEKMTVLLQCLPEIPPAFIFLPGKRLTIKGFRWAPATWMGGWKIDFPDPLGLSSKPMLFPRGYDIVHAPSALTEGGFMVRYPGYRLQTTSLVSATESFRGDPISTHSLCSFRSFVFPSSDSLHEWYQVTPVSSNEARHYFHKLNNRLMEECLELLEDLPQISNGRTKLEMARSLGEHALDRVGLAIILCRPKPGVTPEIALLVETDKLPDPIDMLGPKQAASQNTAIKCNSVMRVWIKLLTHQDHAQLDQLKHAFRVTPSEVPFWGEETKEDQLWVID